MGVGVSSTAFRAWFTSLSWQRGGTRRQQLVTFIPALLLAIIPGCAGVDVLMLSSEVFTPRTSTVEILEQAPTRPYVQIAVLTVDSWWLSTDSRRDKIVEKATELGADAVVFGAPRLSVPGSSNRPAEQSTPSSLPPKDPERVMPDDLHSSLGERVLNGDVSIYLVRGGGHRSGRGGGPGHWGGRPRHPGFRSWRHVPGPGYWGHGFYGPGWGYGPYWGPYWGGYYSYPYWGGYSPYPYYGSYGYSGYGAMSTVTIGTAIHYTD